MKRRFSVSRLQQRSVLSAPAPIREQFPDASHFPKSCRALQQSLKNTRERWKLRLVMPFNLVLCLMALLVLYLMAIARLNGDGKVPSLKTEQRIYLTQALLSETFRNSALIRSRLSVICSLTRRTKNEAQCSVAIHSVWPKPLNRVLAHS